MENKGIAARYRESSRYGTQGPGILDAHQPIMDASHHTWLVIGIPLPRLCRHTYTKMRTPCGLWLKKKASSCLLRTRPEIPGALCCTGSDLGMRAPMGWTSHGCRRAILTLSGRTTTCAASTRIAKVYSLLSLLQSLQSLSPGRSRDDGRWRGEE